ncbi:MAG TPA: MerR family transcriptional regulator [Acidimicrobiales bacterium]|nr:MerR family transcriptional regulator [Acidimicrobiales bacterium]
MALREEFERRLRSTGGRPSDPSWTLTRQVPFKKESWRRLQQLAEAVGDGGRRVFPAQLAAVLIENELRGLEEAEWLAVLRQSRTSVRLSQPEAAEAAGVTHNQLDDWVQQGWIVPAGRRGDERLYGADEIMRAVWLRQLASLVTDIADLAPVIRGFDLTNRYLVVTSGRAVFPAATIDDLARLVATVGTLVVIDQLPERRQLLGSQRDQDDDRGERRA